ncbi:MAG: hypothetical protein A2846_02845 [Candidatus Doudnabacteria bacterium RIFCSPHIGHO2_01_FULL_49_9]|nr:MAG: hypothetical protein A2846_02845 [Candidatus Doudnabacteria bacterium RIFCSPHIGHO2_01_FULL_49_9]
MEDLSSKIALMKKEAEERDARRVADASKLPYLDLSTLAVDRDAFAAFPEDAARAASAVPVKLAQKKLIVAIADPNNPATVALLADLKSRGFSVETFVVSISAVTNYLANYSLNAAPIQREIVSKLGLSKEKLAAFRSAASNAQKATAFFEKSVAGNGSISTTDLLEAIMGSALAADASDLHFETDRDKVLLRFRVDGLLHDIHPFTHDSYRQILNRIKLLSNLKINITDIPQDGRFTIKAGVVEIEIRVSIIPSEFGEAIVMRVLNPKAISLGFSDLGLRADDADIAGRAIKRPNGMVLVTGPTGSGKTTTLYAFLKAVSTAESKTITIEDPIEYHLAGVEQTQVDPKSGYTFASGLRSILRQDPDMILVGEIRDAETAEIAIHASLTGHLVFSTLHTNNAVGAIPRLIDIGIKPSILGPALTLIIAQRLVRRLCPECRVPAQIDADTKAKIDKFLDKLPPRVKRYSEELKMFSAKGCEKCTGGFKGRLGIFEFLELGPEYEALINKDASELAIRSLAVSKGFLEMQSDGILKALAGYTTLEEVEKTTGPLEWAV